jgi:glycogen operon protein
MYRDDMRDFLKGDYWKAPEAARRIAGSTDLYNPFERGTDVSVNFITCHDGFTLNDLYSYNEKHNLENGWNNTDGADDNRSWNCGIEGPTTNRKINKLRRKLMRNAFATLMCSRGTPMFLAGDEFGNSQKGNNNCYCQDNELSWLDWNLLEANRDQFDFFRFMIQYRHAHPVIRKRLPGAVCGMAPIRVYDTDGQPMDITNETYCFGVCYAGYNVDHYRDDIVYVAINTHWEETTVKLPPLEASGNWHLSVNTFGDEQECFYYEDDKAPLINGEFLLSPRSVAVFTAKTY